MEFREDTIYDLESNNLRKVLKLLNFFTKYITLLYMLEPFLPIMYFCKFYFENPCFKLSKNLLQTMK